MSQFTPQIKNEITLLTSMGFVQGTITGLPCDPQVAEVTVGEQVVCVTGVGVSKVITRLAQHRDCGDLVLSYLIGLAINEGVATRDHLAGFEGITAGHLAMFDEDIERFNRLRSQLSRTPEDVLALMA